MKKRLGIILFVLFSTSIATTALAAMFFDSQQAIETGYKATTATPSDFNNDGKMDLITGDPNTGTISILLGNGDGTFQKIAENNLGSLSFVAADFNLDGKTDIATVNNDGYYGWFTIFLGNGDGTFQYSGYYKDWNGGISAITTADFNSDGIVDIATVGGYFYFKVFLGIGDGTFQEMPSYGVGIYPSSIIAEDINNDEKKDIIVVNTDPNEPSLSIYVGNGDGTFQPRPTIFLGAWSYGPSVTIGDYNKDGIMDLAILYGTSAPFPGWTYVLISLGNGDGTFHTNVSYRMSEYSSFFASGDANGDGISDLIMTGSDSILTFLGDGTGAFPAQVKDDFVDSIRAIGDFNNGGKADLAAINSSGNVSILLNTYGGEPLGSIIINNDAESTNSTVVNLFLKAIDDSGSVSEIGVFT